MAALEINFLQGQLEERKRRLELAVVSAPETSALVGLLREVDAALDRMSKGTYGLCLECHDTIERDRLLADPLVQYCLDHLSPKERTALQRDLDLASQVQRNLLPQKGLCVAGWETSYHFAPARGSQRRLLRPHPLRRAASLPARRRVWQRRSRLYVDGAASRSVSQPYPHVPAAR